MEKLFERTDATISLHGLGFIQIQLDADQRLHIWHPALSRRSCWRASQIHDHRFGFTSQVLVGTQINLTHAFEVVSDTGLATHIAYLHEGRRTTSGNRPWLPNKFLRHVGVIAKEVTVAGESYNMLPYVFHSTEPGGDGRVATLMTKRGEGTQGAHSVCKIGVEPDADFNRFALSSSELWQFVRDVLRPSEPAA